MVSLIRDERVVRINGSPSGQNWNNSINDLSFNQFWTGLTESYKTPRELYTKRNFTPENLWEKNRVHIKLFKLISIWFLIQTVKNHDLFYRWSKSELKLKRLSTKSWPKYSTNFVRNVTYMTTEVLIHYRQKTDGVKMYSTLRNVENEVLWKNHWLIQSAL